ncbi:signal peptidase I [Anaerosacchariphilus sp. NSJ-68]|uniref:Signal peptidase I n=2 Tax=Lachnospiraceae TaxID=186803 RepID=A0A923LD43_9FIRM|nr:MULTISPECIES: signal peptidase I [Lachnospiraceae]MBC5659912.1 signal peptidase I [Anaerosacchariphilus hominis]MBC5697579.1 signal peptidase I [Roseburia difficilis]
MGRKNRTEDYIEEEKPDVMRELLGMLVYVGIVLAVTFLIITFVGQRTHVSGESMENTLDDGDQLIVDKVTYRFHAPERYDIIVFPFRYKDNTYYIKRIIGLPGETVQIVDGEIYINGEVLQESYGREVMQDAGLAAEPITLGDDEYFVLGDNRNYSSDSRDPSVALIHRKEIVGRAWLRIWPLSSFGILKHQ